METNEIVMREYIREKKREKADRRNQSLGRVFKAFGRALPRGIRHPDSLITNMHLYRPSRGKPKTRLF